MRAHIIDAGIIINTIEVDSLDIVPGLVAAVAAEGIGWGYDGETFTPPAPTPPPVPQSVSRAQGKAALIAAGLWPAVLTYVAAIADPTDKALAEVALGDTQEWRRDSLFLSSAASALGLSSAQLDQLFIDAGGVVFWSPVSP